MNTKDHPQYFDIECLLLKKKIIKSTISVWIEKRESPKIYDLISKKSYIFQGKIDVFLIEYKYEGRILNTESDRLSNAFQGLCKKLATEDIKMLIKGCNLNYHMIPRLQYSIKAVKLILGERIDSKAPTVCIFDKEEEETKIVTVEEQNLYYDKWIKSIKGIPYVI